MEFRWSLYNYERDFNGLLLPQTRFTLHAQTLLGPIKLQVRIAWQVPKWTWTGVEPVNNPVMAARKNFCRSFTVVLPLESPLQARTLEYFDGSGLQIRTYKEAFVLLCDKKWRSSTGRLANRYGIDRASNSTALQQFMVRRLLNAYGPLEA